MGYQSKASKSKSQPVVATRSGRKPKQDLKSMHTIQKPTPQDKIAAKKAAASKVAMDLVVGVTYEPAQPAPAVAAKRSHKGKKTFSGIRCHAKSCLSLC